MVARYREDLISEVYDTYSQVGRYSNPYGSCVADPGDATSLSGTFDANGSFLTQYEKRTMNDVVTPNFHKLRSQGKIVNNPMDSTYERVTMPKLDIYFSSTAHLYGCTPARYYPWIEHRIEGTRSIDSLLGADTWLDSSGIDADSLADRAISKAWSNIDRSEMLILASAAELGQTLDGLLYILKKVYKIAAYTRKMQFKKLKGEITPKELREIYLNARYNLRPLAYDVAGMLKVLNAPLTKAMRQTFRGNLVESSKNDDTVEVYALYHANFNLKCVFSRHIVEEVTCRAGVLTDQQPLSHSELLGVDQIVKTAWDLIPFSFIIDWFANVGDTICAWSPRVGSRTLASWVMTTKVKTQTTTLLNSVAESNDSTYKWMNTFGSVSDGTATKISVEKSRVPEYSRPIIPSIRLNLDPLKILDLGLIVSDLAGFKFKSQ